MDSGSTDRTEEIAKEFGAKFSVREFDNYASQKNYAIGQASNEWIFSIDADEELTPELRDAIVAAITSGDSDAYSVKRRLIFQGRQLNYGRSRDSIVRLFRKAKGRFESPIHERLVIDGQTGSIRTGEILHYSYKNLEDYFSRFNRYTGQIAKKHFESNKSVNGFMLFLRPWVEFVYRYFIRLGFLDGREGYTYALLSSFYTYVKYAKLQELQDSRK